MKKRRITFVLLLTLLTTAGGCHFGEFLIGGETYFARKQRLERESAN